MSIYVYRLVNCAQRNSISSIVSIVPIIIRQLIVTLFNKLTRIIVFGQFILIWFCFFFFFSIEIRMILIFVILLCVRVFVYIHFILISSVRYSFSSTFIIHIYLKPSCNLCLLCLVLSAVELLDIFGQPHTCLYCLLLYVSYIRVWSVDNCDSGVYR